MTDRPRDSVKADLRSPWHHEPRQPLTDHACATEGCDRTAKCMSAAGPLCGVHYQRFAKYGTVTLPTKQREQMLCVICGKAVEGTYARVRFKKRGYGYCSYACAGSAKIHKADEDAAMRFMRNVVMRGDDECWPFNGAKSTNGYSTFNWREPGDIRSRPHGAHRMMWLILNGPIPTGKEICHTCDNPECCNPGHLWLGTHKENMEDMARKGRGSKRGFKGVDHPQAKLTEAHVVEIRTSQAPAKSLARRFGVTPENIRNVRKRKTWAHV